MRRLPWLTVVVAVVTVAGLVVEQTVPGTLGNLERIRAALHGEWWRWLTSLLVQDGHVAGGVFNILGLLLCGAAAEQVVRRRTWLATYVGIGLVGQVFGQLWQPVGGGNSVAVCGLAALCVAAAVRGERRPPVLLFAPLMWVGALASDLWTPLLAVGLLLGLLGRWTPELPRGTAWLRLGGLARRRAVPGRRGRVVGGAGHPRWRADGGPRPDPAVGVAAGAG